MLESHLHNACCTSTELIQIAIRSLQPSVLWEFTDKTLGEGLLPPEKVGVGVGRAQPSSFSPSSLLTVGWLKSVSLVNPRGFLFLDESCFLCMGLGDQVNHLGEQIGHSW